MTPAKTPIERALTKDDHDCSDSLAVNVDSMFEATKHYKEICESLVSINQSKIVMELSELYGCESVALATYIRNNESDGEKMFNELNKV